jgi:phosphomevalonate kinase
MERLLEISQKATELLNKQDIPGFLSQCDEFFLELKHLGTASGADIISFPHQEIAKIALKNGAVYKPSGAGGGDIGLIMTDSQEVAKRVSDNILRSKYQLLNLNVAKNGSNIKIL